MLCCASSSSLDILAIDAGSFSAKLSRIFARSGSVSVVSSFNTKIDGTVLSLAKEAAL